MWLLNCPFKKDQKPGLNLLKCILKLLYTPRNIYPGLHSRVKLALFPWSSETSNSFAQVSSLGSASARTPVEMKELHFSFGSELPSAISSESIHRYSVIFTENSCN